MHPCNDVAAFVELALRNLIDNAIAHGKPHGNVGVIIGTGSEGVKIAVEDDGPGFPEERVTRVGERFARGEQSHGSGLGLSIVRAIAALHGGSVTISRPAAGGARVALHLPSASVADETESVALQTHAG